MKQQLESAQEDASQSSSESEVSDIPDPVEESEPRPRKRRRLGREDDLEGAYLDRLAREEQKEMNERAKSRAKLATAAAKTEDVDSEDDDTASSASNDLEDISEDDTAKAIPQHESLTTSTTEYEKTRRTAFLSNVSVEAIKSKVSRKILETHLKSVLDTETKEGIESIRFRSTAFNVTAGPKKAAFAKKDLMDDTTKSTNVYVVFTTESAARKVAKKLNGTVVLDRHLRADWLAHPMAVDHKRCVFVGNLNFVDLESNADTNQDEEKQKRRPKSKEPADAEEGLWRTFGKCGTVESVRVVRDAATRIGKGFAYVQYSDEVGVEKALALDGKRFPPMLPRTLRVSRAKRVLKKDLKRKREDNDESKKRPTSNKSRGRPGPRKKMDGVVFEGYRASADKAMKFKTKGKKKTSTKPTNRSSKRGAAFKASGGKKKSDAR